MSTKIATTDRRTFTLEIAGAAGLFLAGCAGAQAASPPAGEAHGGKKEEKEEDVSPAEDLMREHGGLNRMLLIYEESARRIEANEALPPEALAKTASLIQRFIEGYHEKLEEEHLFPRFEKAGKLVDLVTVLRAQHLAGRRLTEVVLRLGAPASLQGADRPALVSAMRQFIRMYRPHEAREDTVLFPAFRGLVSDKEYDELGEAFEDKEHQLFGKEGFEGVVAEVAKIEQSLNIYDLAAFTPR